MSAVSHIAALSREMVERISLKLMLFLTQRAECVDALKRHVKNRISLQKDQDKNDPEITSTACVTPSSFTFNTNDATPGSLQCQGKSDSVQPEISHFTLL